MIYLESFTLPSADSEESFVLNYPYQLEMQCYNHDVYPFKIFPQKKLRRLEFEPVTLLYGSNGSGKSTLLNVICEKLRMDRSAPFNNTAYFDDFISRCDYSMFQRRSVPKGSKLIASDDVFDFLLDVRSINEGISNRREELFSQYEDASRNRFQLKSLDDYEVLKKHNDAKRLTKSQFVSRRLGNEASMGSNGESALAYFAKAIGDNALFLLDEPENSLSIKLQEELCRFVSDSARFFGCQFIISTHSPVLLSMNEAVIYDLDSVPVTRKVWTELENVRRWFDFFEKHRNEFL